MSNMPMEQEQTHSQRVSQYITRDKDAKFESFMRDYLLDGTITAADREIFLTEVSKCICSHCAVKCASVLLEGKAGKPIDPNVPLHGGLSLLHLAAQSLHGGLTNLVLYYGGDPNLYIADDQTKVPLTFALDALCHHPCVTDWDSKKSVFKLFYIFCLPELYQPLQIIGVLALRTNQIHEISLRFVKAGELVKLCALLMMTWPKLVAPYEGISSCPIGECILHELRMVSDQEAKLAPSEVKELHLLRERKDNLISAWKILRVLDLARNRFMEYREHSKFLPKSELPYHLSMGLLFEFPLADEDMFCDDVRCLMPRLPPKEKARLYKSLEKQICLGSTLSSTSERCRSVRVSGSRSFHSFPDLNCSFVKSARDKPIRRSVQAVMQSLPLLSGDMLARLAFVAKRIPK